MLLCGALVHEDFSALDGDLDIQKVPVTVERCSTQRVASEQHDIGNFSGLERTKILRHVDP